MADSSSYSRSGPYRLGGLLLGVGAAIVAALGVALVATYPGASPLVLLWFYASGCAALAISLWYPSSAFVFLLSSFLFVGFIAKAVANFVFGVALIEPVGSFTTQWDQALAFAASGLSGVCVAGLLAARYPSFRQTDKAAGATGLARSVLGAFAFLVVVSGVVYWANYSFHILRIGFPLGIAMDARLYAVAAFVITWGALLGGLTAALWLVELRGWPYSTLIHTATFLGLLAAVSMGSRIQLLLYVLAALVVVVVRRRQVRSWMGIALATGLAALVFAGSLAVVSFERTFDFSLSPPVASAIPARPLPHASASAPVVNSAAPPRQTAAAGTGPSPGDLPAPPGSPAWSPTQSMGAGAAPGPASSGLAPAPTPGKPPAPAATSIVNKVETVTRDRFATRDLLHQLSNLAIMRWVGMEGVMTAAANPAQLGASLFFAVLREDPAAGSHAIYQKMSGDRYGKVEYYTFLTLPGPVGVASLSGSLLVVAGFMFILTLIGHSIEWVAARVTQNPATASVTGVSLAYLVVQMGFPWTLLVYAIELVLSVLFLGVVWRTARWLTSRNARNG